MSERTSARVWVCIVSLCVFILKWILSADATKVQHHLFFNSSSAVRSACTLHIYAQIRNDDDDNYYYYIDKANYNCRCECVCARFVFHGEECQMIKHFHLSVPEYKANQLTWCLEPISYMVAGKFNHFCIYWAHDLKIKCHNIIMTHRNSFIFIFGFVSFCRFACPTN